MGEEVQESYIDAFSGGNSCNSGSALIFFLLNFAELIGLRGTSKLY